MVNKLIITILFFLFFFNAEAQIVVKAPGGGKSENFGSGNLSVSTFVLKNGMKVYLNEDHSMNKVYGAVVVRGGAKYDPQDATGIAHYLEHMLFKGTENIGTTNYKEERIWLDSVAFMYSMLPYAKGDEPYRQRILKKIDYYSQRAAEFAIPGEFDNLISELGGTGLNAFTDYEKIVYHNYFPAENLKPWLELYYERFSHAVFRLFQTELETVYEEKNMSQDNMFRQVYEKLYKNFYPTTVYGKQTVLGSVEHLKTPSIYKMVSYYKEHYVANNMALILIGNFESAEARAEIEQVFGKYRYGERQNFPVESEKALQGRKQVVERLTPVPVGIIGYRTTGEFSDDRPAIDLMSAMLSNENKTGFLDSLQNKNKLLYSAVLADYHSDLGGLFVAYVPHFPFQSLKKAEKIITQQIARIKNGDFSDAFFKSVKKSLLKNNYLQLESPRSRMVLIADAFVAGKNPDFFGYNKKIEILSKADIMRLASQYLADNYLSFHSKMGKSNPVKLKKPEFTPVKPRIDKGSTYAQTFSRKLGPGVVPKYLVKNKDYFMEEPANNLTFYYVKNPYNQIFTYKIKIYAGDNTIPGLSLAAEYLNNVGTEKMKFSEFGKKLQEMGTDISFSADENYFVATVTGFDNQFEESLKMLADLLKSPEKNDKIIKQLVGDRKVEDRVLKRDAASKARMLAAYGMYGDNSRFKNRMSLKQIKRLKSKDLIAMINSALGYKSDLSYAGTLPLETVESLVLINNVSAKNLRQNLPLIKSLQVPQGYTVYFLKDKKAVQSQIKIVVPSRALWQEERPGIKAFNNYFGIGLNSMVFKEIREYRSLAYSAWAYFSVPYDFSKPGHLYGSTSTQADKTLETVKVFSNLLDTMPKDSYRMSIVKKSLINSINSNIPDFRHMADLVAYYRLSGYTSDPREKDYEYFSRMKLGDIQSFFDMNVAGRYRLINIVGDPDKFDIKKLSQFGDFKEFKLKDIFTK